MTTGIATSSSAGDTSTGWTSVGPIGESGGQRTMLYDWYHDFGQSIDWSTGLMGLHFSAGRYAGKAVGDYSENFFGATSK
jgi:hypothetical protein